MAKKISASDIFAEEDIFLGIRQSAEKTILSFQEIDAEVKKLAGNLKKDLSTADFGNTKGINSFVAATQKANDAKTKSIQIDKVLAQATKDVIAADKALVDIEIKKQKLAQEQIKTNNAITKSENDKAKATQKAAQASKVEMDTYKQLAASTRDLKNQSKELGAQMLASEKAGRTGTAAYAALETQFREVTAAAQAGDAELKQIDKTVGDNFRNVGNYEVATKGLKQQLREMTVALQNMESTDPRFKQMTIDAGKLKDQIQDTNAVIKSTAGSAVENLGNGIAKAGKVGIDAFAGMTGAMGLFGIESEGAMQAMLKLQQLAAMSEALQSLGALSDTMTEVRASFVAAASKLGLFTSAKVADTTITNTQTVATEAATVATSGLGKAMKALPIVAIIAGIAALAYAVYEYVSSSKDAEKATKARVEAEKKANEEAKATREFIAQESSEFVGLVYQLKATNKGSEERSKLIKQINSQYGTTLKNLSDETAFQAALNLAVKDYIAYQRQKYQLTTNKKKIEEILKKEESLTAKLTAAQIAYNQAQFQGGQMGGSYQNTKQLQDAAEADIKRYKGTLKILDNQLMALGYSNIKLINDTEGKYIPAVKGAAKATTDLTNATNADTKAITDNTVALIEAEEWLNSQRDATRLLKEERHAASMQLVEDMKAAEMIDVNRKKSITDLRVLEAELSLKRLEGSGNTKAITKAEEELKNARIASIQAQLAIDLKLTDNINERIELEKRAELEILNLDTKRLEQKTKNIKTEEELIKAAADFFIAQSNRKIEQIDKEIAAANTQYTTLQTLAANGNINAKESLAEQQRIINEANAQKERELKKQQRIKLAESVYSTYNAKVAGGSEHPLLDTIKDTMLLQQFIASLPTFYDGTEDTGKNGNGIDNKGGFHAILHPNERVIPKSLNEKIGSLSNEALAKMANEYQNGKIIRSNSQLGSSFDTAILVNKMDELTNAIKSKPETNIEIGEITQSVMEIVKSTKQGNTTTYNRYKVRR